MIAVQCAPPVSHSGHWLLLYTNLLGNQCPPPQAIGDVAITHQLMLCFAVRGQSLQPEPITTLALLALALKPYKGGFAFVYVTKDNEFQCWLVTQVEQL